MTEYTYVIFCASKNYLFSIDTTLAKSYAFGF